MIVRRWLLILAILLSVGLLVDAQTVTGRISHQRHTAKRPAPRVAYVAICESRSAYAYHNSMCRGLARCTHGVSRVSVAQARDAGYVPCRICY